MKHHQSFFLWISLLLVLAVGSTTWLLTRPLSTTFALETVSDIATSTPSLTVVPSSSPTVSPSPTPIVWSDPITIRQGGTYSGNWQSSDPHQPAVTIKTTEPVIIENCHLRGPGALIKGYADLSQSSGMDLTVRHCSGEGVAPDEPGLAQVLICARDQTCRSGKQYSEVHTRN